MKISLLLFVHYLNFGVRRQQSLGTIVSVSQSYTHKRYQENTETINNNEIIIAWQYSPSTYKYACVKWKRKKKKFFCKVKGSRYCEYNIYSIHPFRR